MFITLTVATGSHAGQKVELMVANIFGVTRSETLLTTLVMSVSGHAIGVKESVDEVKGLVYNEINKTKGNIAQG